MKKELKIYLLQVWKNDAITAQDFDNIAKLAGVKIGANISVAKAEGEQLPYIDARIAYALPREAKTVILGALYSGELDADTLHRIAQTIGVRIAPTVEVINEECADTLRKVLKKK